MYMYRSLQFLEGVIRMTVKAGPEVVPSAQEISNAYLLVDHQPMNVSLTLLAWDH